MLELQLIKETWSFKVRSRCLVFAIGVQLGIFHASFTGPGEHFGARLASAHVADTRLVPSVAYFGSVATFRSLLLSKHLRHIFIFI